MGISDRDYVRSSSRSPFLGGTGLDAVGWIIAVNVGVYLLQFLFPNSFTDALALKPQALTRGQVWRFVTYDFLHSIQGVMHIVVNMYVLYMTGSKILTRLSQREFLLFYLTAGVVAGLMHILWQLGRGDDAPTVGASGAVAAALTLYAMFWPREVWLIMLVIPVPVIAIVALYAIFDLHPLLMELREGVPSGDHVAHMAHLGGMAFAVAYYKFGWRLERLLGDFNWQSLRKKLRRKPSLKVHRPESDEIESSSNLQEQMDRLLEKIHAQGEASLSHDERETLNRISRQIRTRRGG